MYYKTTYESPVGLLTLSSDGENLAGLWIEGQKHFGGTMPLEMTACHELPVFAAAKAWLDRYFAGERPHISQLPLAPVGGEFRQTVWKLLTQIPYGQVVTYGQLARQIAAMSGKQTIPARAVGGAVGHNPISIIIPCHRVVGSTGSLTGFSGGIEMKIHLLKHEGVDMTGLFVPKKGTTL